MIAAALAALALSGNPSVKPWPVGPGPRYLPRAAPASVLAGKPLGPLRCGAREPGTQLHLELFVDRRVIVVPAGIGVADPSVRRGAMVVPRGCTYPVRTLSPAGIVEVARGAKLRLADLFRVWGQPLGPGRLASFRSAAPVRAYVDGRPVSGPVGEIPLTRHAEIVLELGGYVPPHSFFLFAGGDS